LLIDALVQKTNYHPLTSFEPICNLVDVPSVITVNAAAPYRKLADLWAPAKTPKEAVSELAAWFTAALQTLEVKQKLVAQGLFPVGVCATGFSSYLRRKYDEYGRALREANIKAE
jgi:tripartite-type tricarboxylate transporter receptor subunit TctC